jgi:hypothetical protein
LPVAQKTNILQRALTFQRGIYQLEGDNLKLRYVGPDAKRPVNFDAGTMDERSPLVVWKR